MRLLYTTILLAMMAMNRAPVTKQDIMKKCGDASSFAQKTTAKQAEISQYKEFIKTATFFHPKSGYNLVFEEKVQVVDPQGKPTEYSKLTVDGKEVLLDDTDILELMKLLLKSTQSSGNDRKAYVKVVNPTLDCYAYVFDVRQIDEKYSFVVAQFMITNMPGIEKKVAAAGKIQSSSSEQDLNNFIKGIPFQSIYASSYGIYDNDRVSLYYENSVFGYEYITFRKEDKLALAKLVADHGHGSDKALKNNTSTHAIVCENRRYVFWFNGSRFCVMPMSV